MPGFPRHRCVLTPLLNSVAVINKKGTCMMEWWPRNTVYWRSKWEKSKSSVCPTCWGLETLYMLVECVWHIWEETKACSWFPWKGTSVKLGDKEGDIYSFYKHHTVLIYLSFFLPPFFKSIYLFCNTVISWYLPGARPRTPCGCQNLRIPKSRI